MLDEDAELLAGAEVAGALLDAAPELELELELLGLLGLLLPHAAAPRPTAHASSTSESGRSGCIRLSSNVP